MAEISLNIFSMFADREGAELTTEICASLKRKLGTRFQLHQKAWSVELLKSAKLRTLAAREAVNSDLVILAMMEGEDVSAELRAWFNLWRNRRRSTPAAFVALLKQANRTASNSMIRRLAAFAASAKMDFFCHSTVESEWDWRQPAIVFELDHSTLTEIPPPRDHTGTQSRP